MKNYKEIMLSITTKAQEKENENKKKKILDARGIAEREENYAKSSYEMSKIEERSNIGRFLYSLFVPKGEFHEVYVKDKKCIDMIKGQFIVRNKSKTDEWTIYKNRVLLFKLKMLEQNKYLFYITENALNSINTDKELQNAIKKGLIYIDTQTFDYKIYLNYDATKELLSELRYATGKKRNNIVENIKNA